MEASWQDLAAGAAVLDLDPDGRPVRPLLLLDLDRLGPPPNDLRPSSTPGAVVVGVTEGDPPATALPYLTCWVAPGEVDDLVGTVGVAPVAATTLAGLLGTGATSTPAALVAESLAYSALQGGAEFRDWLAGTTATGSADTDDPVLVERTGQVLTITLNRPARHNAYSAAMRDALRDALAVARADPELRVELRGAGPSFCSGGDLAEFGRATDPAVAHLVRVTTGAARSLDLLRPRTRVVLHGACVGAGIELAAFAGRVEADDDAWFHLPEVGMGLVPGAGGTASIPARVGRWRTAQLALTRRRLDLGTALAWGLVDAPAR
ncbi:enoyl-CoA hydratase/isomerase family protein [Nocardioides marmoriginsengisoli]|uniref:Enoyl-CoA hydratase/isomerase family protein n=2 Tax=Nocardioides marmoriginsengisoli TaxID=661483 RepID=A0A3N0CD63_9ACTN|nr:enoyl-CoA hydratase/isomerase family protein [Nocardioides marmoriginsengisoli]